MYSDSLKELCTPEILERVRLITLNIIQSEPIVEMALKWEPSHIFMEEFRAFPWNQDVNTTGLGMLAKFALKPETFAWINLDMLQGFESDDQFKLEGDWQKFVTGNFI